MNKLTSLFAFILIFAFSVTNNVKAQTVKDIFSDETPVTYFGVDFSNAKFYGDPGTVDGVEMVGLLKKINDLIIKEYEKKYNIALALKRNTVNLDISLTDKLNAGISAGKFITSNPGDINKLDESAIKKIVAKYKTSGKGIGMVFIVDNMDKPKNETTAWVTFFSLSSKKVILSEKMSGKAAGFGFRNFWTRPIYDMIKDIQMTYSSKWSTK
ncbi:MAG: hypothetical protein U0U67_13500 [Chitinophagales bacterium]